MRGIEDVSGKFITFVKIWISMAGEFQQTIDRINAKSQILLKRYALIEKARAEAARRIAELEAEVDTLKKENGKLHTEVEFLKIATTIAPDRADVAATRALLTELVREIDKCITELND